MRRGQPVSTEPFCVIHFVAECPKCFRRVGQQQDRDKVRNDGIVQFFCPGCDMDFNAEFDLGATESQHENP
jgi:hypothetical protein